MMKLLYPPPNYLSKLTLRFSFLNNFHPITSPSTSETKKRPNSLTITTSSPTKVRLTSSEYDDAPQTPDQPTIPKNPAFSGDSIESTDEDNTKRMIGTLIDTALLSLRSDFARIPWPKYARKCRLRSSGYFLSNSTSDK